MRREVVLFVRAAIADVRVHQNQGRLLALGLGLCNGLRYVAGVVAVQNRARVPAIGLKTPGNVFGEINLGAPASVM